MDYWRYIQRRLHSESALHYPRNKVRLILRAYINGTLNQFVNDAKEYAEQGFLLTCSGSYLDERGNELNLPRKKGNFAKGTVTFTLTEDAKSKLKIPRNTTIQNRVTSYEYITTRDAYIEEGEKNVVVSVQSITYGKRFNADIGELTLFSNQYLPSNLSVNNEGTITGGSDGETDSEYRKRLFNSYSAHLTINYLKKQGIIIYSKKNYEDEIRINMTSLNPYLNNKYAAIPPNDEILDFLDNDVIHDKHMMIYIKGWDD